jgi:hypothetical protein
MLKLDHTLIILTTIYYSLCPRVICLLYMGNTAEWRAAVTPLQFHIQSHHVDSLKSV